MDAVEVLVNRLVVPSKSLGTEGSDGSERGAVNTTVPKLGRIHISTISVLNLRSLTHSFPEAVSSDVLRVSERVATIAGAVEHLRGDVIRVARLVVTRVNHGADSGCFFRIREVTSD